MIRHLFSVLIVILILILIPYTTSTASSTYDDITPQMNRYVSHMIALGKIIERDKATVSPLLDRIIYQREALGNELRKIYLSSDL